MSEEGKTNDIPLQAIPNVTKIAESSEPEGKSEPLTEVGSITLPLPSTDNESKVTLDQSSTEALRPKNKKPRLIANYIPERQEEIRQANRIAARECRKRKKQVVQELEMTLKLLTEENQMLSMQHELLTCSLQQAKLSRQFTNSQDQQQQQNSGIAGSENISTTTNNNNGAAAPAGIANLNTQLSISLPMGFAGQQNIMMTGIPQMKTETINGNAETPAPVSGRWNA